MTDERFNHLEVQINQLKELVNRSTTTQQDLNSLRQDMKTLHERVELIEGSMTIEIRKGFKSIRNHLDDLSLEKSENHRKNIFDEDLDRRRLNRQIPAFDKREDD